MLPNLLVYNSMYQTAVCEKVNKTFSCSGIKRLQQEQKTHFWERPLSNIENNQFVHRTALFPTVSEFSVVSDARSVLSQNGAFVV